MGHTIRFDPDEIIRCSESAGRHRVQQAKRTAGRHRKTTRTSQLGRLQASQNASQETSDRPLTIR